MTGTTQPSRAASPPDRRATAGDAAAWRRAIPRLAATLAFYGGAIVLLTWPLASSLRTQLPRTKFICDFDLRQVIWALSWQTHALLTAPSRLFEANIYHPTPHALLYADAGVGALPYFAPVYWATGDPVLASNLVFLAGLALTASALHLVVTRWTGLATAGFVAAGTLVVTPWVLWTWIPAAPNYALLHFVPPIVFLVASPLSRGRATVLTVLLVCQGAVNPYYAGATMATIMAIACARLVSPTERASARRLLAAVVPAVLVLAAVYAPYAWLRLHEPHLEQQSPWLAERLRPRLLAMHVPHDLFADPDKPTGVPVALLLVIAIGAAMRLLPRRERTAEERTAWRCGVAWAAAGLVLSLHSTIAVLGWTIRLPWAPLDRLPVVNLLRDPARIGVGALFGLAILAGVAFAEYVRWLERALRIARPAVLRGVVAMAVLVVSMHQWFRFDEWPWAAPYPLATAGLASSPIMDMLRRPGGPVLELPVDPAFARLRGQRRSNALAWQAHAMLESIGHWRPLLNGYGGFYPAGFVERMELAARLPDREALSRLRASTGVELIIVRAVPRSRTAMDRWNELARRGGGEGMRFIAEDRGDLLFAVSDSIDQPSMALRGTSSLYPRASP